MGLKDDELKQSKAENLLQMSMFRIANQRQDTALKDLKLELQTLQQALITLTNKMAGSSSSKRGRVGGVRTVENSVGANSEKYEH